MKKRFEFKFVTLALAIASMTLMAAVSARAQEDDVTSIDDFLEETDDGAGTGVANDEKGEGPAKACCDSPTEDAQYSDRNPRLDQQYPI